ncbi:hypothetical protein Tco_1226092 [Tanacetum coccineum]
MDDEPMWAADRVVAPTPGSAITIPEQTNFPLKNETLTEAWLRMKEMLRNCHGHNLTKAFADEGSSTFDTDKTMVQMDSMTMKMNAQYKEFQSRSNCNHCRGNHSTADCNDDDTPMSREEEAKFMQTFRRMPNYGKFLKELVSNKHKLEQISSAFLSNESSAMIKNKVPPKLKDHRSFLILFGSERMIFHIDSAMKQSYSNDDTCFSIELIDEILKEDFDALLDEVSKILYSIEGTPLEGKIFAKFDESWQ